MTCRFKVRRRARSAMASTSAIFLLFAVLDEVSRVDPRAKKIKVQELVDRRFLDEMEKSGFFDKLWGKG